MKARLPISYLNLPKREKDAIDNLVKSEVDRALTSSTLGLKLCVAILTLLVHLTPCFLDLRDKYVLLAGKTVTRKLRIIPLQNHHFLFLLETR